MRELPNYHFRAGQHHQHHHRTPLRKVFRRQAAGIQRVQACGTIA
jgi:hypothetical protein